MAMVWAVALLKEEPKLPYCLGNNLISHPSEAKSGSCTSSFLAPPPACWAALGVMPTVSEPPGCLLHGLIPLTLHITSRQKRLPWTHYPSDSWCGGVSSTSRLWPFYSSCRWGGFLHKKLPFSLENTCVESFWSGCLLYFSRAHGSHHFYSVSEWWMWVLGTREEGAWPWRALPHAHFPARCGQATKGWLSLEKHFQPQDLPVFSLLWYPVGPENDYSALCPLLGWDPLAHTKPTGSNSFGVNNQRKFCIEKIVFYGEKIV